MDNETLKKLFAPKLRVAFFIDKKMSFLVQIAMDLLLPAYLSCTQISDPKSVQYIKQRSLCRCSFCFVLLVRPFFACEGLLYYSTHISKGFSSAEARDESSMYTPLYLKEESWRWRGEMKLTRKNERLIFTRMNARKTSAPDVGRFGDISPKDTRYCMYGLVVRYSYLLLGK